MPQRERHGWATLRTPALRRLVISHALTSTGQTFGMVPVAVVLYARTQSTAWVAAAAVAHYLPHLLLSGVAGVMADRHDRVRLLRWSSAGRAAGFLALAAAVVAPAAAPPAVLLALVAAITVLGTPAAPALMASVPDVVVPEDLVAANAAVVGLDSLAFVAGPALGGALLIGLPPAAVLLLGAGLFLAGWRCLVPLERAPAPAPARAVAPGPTPPHGTLRDQLAAGIRAVLSSQAAAPLAVLVVVNLLYGATAVLLVPVAEELLGTGQAGVGALNLAIGLGSIAGLVAPGSALVARRATSPAVHAAAIVGTGLPFAGLAALHATGPAFALMVLSGAASMVAEVLALTWLQRSLPGDVIGRVFGLVEALVVSAILAGSAVAPLLTRMAGLKGTLVLLGAVLPVAAAIRLAAPGRPPRHRVPAVDPVVPFNR